MLDNYKNILKIMLDKGAKMPVREHVGDAGLDIFSTETKLVTCFRPVRIHTGVHVSVPYGCKGNFESKSGLMLKGITCRGTIDYGYTGEICPILFKKGIVPYLVRKGQKVTQLTITDCRLPKIVDISDMEATERGDGGFGSTGL